MACNCDGSKSGGSCQCVFRPGLNTSVTGFGSDREPFQIGVERIYLQGGATGSAVVQVTGSGDVDSPYIMVIQTVEQGTEKWTRWAGSQTAYDEVAPHLSDTLYAVTSPTPGLPGVTGMYVGSTPAIAAYVGTVQVL